jgi:oligoribonuclease NrnB/cAMP/cGMP phosphodiesterase (DHH superfamily)
MILHISHNDLDGVGCGILVKAAYPSVKTIYTHYDELPGILANLPPEYSTLIITDLSPTDAWVERIVGERELTIIDHHITSAHLAEYPFVYHSIEKCATLLTWEKLTADGFDLSAYKDFAECVNDYDLWLMKRPDGLRMNTLLNLLGMSRFEKRFFATPYEGFNPSEELIITLEEERRENYMLRAFKNTYYFTDIEGRNVAALYAEQYVSELGNYIITHSEADYVVLVDAQRRKVSLRSSREVDISHIAKGMGGGGHKNAAGFGNADIEGLTEMLVAWGIIRER